MAAGALFDELRGIAASAALRTEKASRIAAGIRAAGPYRWVGVYDVDRGAGMVVNVAWSGPAAPAYRSFPIDRGLTGRAISARAIVNVGDVVAESTYLEALGDTRSEIIVPVLDDGGVVGTLDVESERREAFDASAEAFLAACAAAIRALWIT